MKTTICAQQLAGGLTAPLHGHLVKLHLGAARHPAHAARRPPGPLSVDKCLSVDVLGRRCFPDTTFCPSASAGLRSVELRRVFRGTTPSRSPLFLNNLVLLAAPLVLKTPFLGSPGLASAFSPGRDPRVPGSSPMSGSLHGACFSLCLVSASVCVCVCVCFS